MISLESNINAVLRRSRKSLSQASIRSATVSALNDAINVSKNEAVRQIRAQGYRLASTKIKERLAIKRAAKSLMVGSMRAMGRGVNLFEYGARQVGKSALQRGTDGRLKVKQGGGVSVLVKSSRKLIKHAFIVKGRVLIRAEYLTRGDGPHFGSPPVEFTGGFAIRGSQVRQLTGPGVPTMLANQVVMRVLRTKAPPHFEKRFLHYFNRELAK
jgi:hypothetical protein